MPAKPDPGEVYVYSNAGISLAAALMEKASGKAWEQLVDDYLNKQLKLHFKIGFPDARSENQPWGHILNADTVMALAPGFDYHIATVMRPAGDLNVNIVNYTKFIQLFLKGYSRKNNFLRSETYTFLLTALPHYTFGWANKKINGHEYNYHSGSAGTFGCFTKIDRNTGHAVIIMINYVDGGSAEQYSSNSRSSPAKVLASKHTHILLPIIHQADHFSCIIYFKRHNLTCAGNKLNPYGFFLGKRCGHNMQLAHLYCQCIVL